MPAITGALGVAGGVLLGRSALQQKKKFLGIPIPRSGGGGVKVDFSDMSKNIGEAGRQFGKLASEIRTAREKAEKVSKAIS
jgi:hypothetical protein